jgi:hypothetical protein
LLLSKIKGKNSNQWTKTAHSGNGNVYIVIQDIGFQKMRMLPNPTPTTFIVLILGVTIFIFIMLLSVLLELKRPKDAGPRMIVDDANFIQPKIRDMPIVNVEEEQGFDQILINRIAEVIAVLPNLEE